MDINEKLRPNITPRKIFLKRLSLNILVGVLVIMSSLGLGMWGYGYFEKMSLIDAYVNAAMILSGMGPVSELKTDAGKIFAGSFALFSGIIFLVIIAIILAPVIHRIIHKLHMKETK